MKSISHDLKTPAMVIMSHAEAIIDGVYIDSIEKTAEIIKNEAISLEKKIKQLLYLNTLDYVLENNTEGGEVKLQVAIENIVENGLRYAKEKICITVKQEGSFVNLDIYNDGPNIEQKHITHIFDNLYKDKTGNFGLGLAITKKIIDFYNGEIEALNREKGVSFIIKLPV